MCFFRLMSNNSNSKTCVAPWCQVRRLILHRPSVAGRCPQDLAAAVSKFQDCLGMSKQQVSAMLSRTPYVLDFPAEVLAPRGLLLQQLVGRDAAFVSALVSRNPRLIDAEERTLQAKCQAINHAAAAYPPWEHHWRMMSGISAADCLAANVKVSKRINRTREWSVNGATGRE